MSGFVGWLNGTLVPDSALVVSATDRGFTLGDAAYDVVRTYRHRPLRLERHVARLYRSLEYLQIDVPFEPRRMEHICRRVLEENLSRTDTDVMLVMRVSRGVALPLYTPSDQQGPPTIIVHCVPVPYDTLAPAFRQGMHLVPSRLRRTPPSSLDPHAKTHARLNLVRAHVEVGERDPRALPVLLDEHGHVTETLTANIFAVRDGRLLTPRPDAILPGMTRELILELAGGNSVGASEADLTLDDLRSADELFLTAAVFGVMPVGQFDGERLTGEIPGPTTTRISALFAEVAGLDPRTQALSLAPGEP
jgi:branched-chain amino acid aminotransferase